MPATQVDRARTVEGVREFTCRSCVSDRCASFAMFELLYLAATRNPARRLNAVKSGLSRATGDSAWP
jgi:hypothetical protein